MLLGALTVLLSRGALPGEMLYSIKRASESAEIGLTSGQEAKGLKHLDFASTRLEEVSDLIERQAATAAGAGPVAAGIGPDEAALVLDNLRAFDEQARTGSRLILPLAAQPTGPSPAELGEWARSQSARIDTLSPSLDGDGAHRRRRLAADAAAPHTSAPPRSAAPSAARPATRPTTSARCPPAPATPAPDRTTSQASTTAIPESTTTSTTSSTTTSSTSVHDVVAQRDVQPRQRLGRLRLLVGLPRAADLDPGPGPGPPARAAAAAGRRAAAAAGSARPQPGLTGRARRDRCAVGPV